MLAALTLCATGGAADNNFLRYEGRDYRHLVCLWGFSPPKSPNWYRRRLMAFPVGRIISETPLAGLSPSQLCFLYYHNFDKGPAGKSEPIPFSIIRGGSVVSATDALEATDVLLFQTPDIEGDGGWVPAYSLFFNRRAEERMSAAPAGYGTVPPADLSKAFTAAHDADMAGYLDWSPEIDLSWPDVLIQADGACSGQWGLWYEWSAASSPYAGWPRNVLQHFSTMNLGDNPQYPEDYLEHYELCGDPRVRAHARHGLETLLSYRIPSAPWSWPFGAFPWKQRVWNANEPIEGTTLEQAHGGQSPFAWRTIAKSQKFFKDDPAFYARLGDAYAQCRRAYFANLKENLRFPNDAGTAIEAVAAHYELTSDPKDKADLQTLTTAVLNCHRAGIAGYGSEMPKYVMGLAAAYKALHDPACLAEAKDFLVTVICPNLWRNRQFFDRDPKDDNRNPDPVSGHWEAMQFLRLYDVTKDPFYLVMGGFVWGSFESTSDGRDLYHKWSTGPSAEGNFFTLHRYTYCQKYPSLYRIIETFGRDCTRLSDWQKWPLRADAGNCSIRIDRNGVTTVSPHLTDASRVLLSVGRGVGGGNYRPGDAVSLAADPPAVGKVFDRWVIRYGGLGIIANSRSARTSLTMPAGPAGILATYRSDPGSMTIIGTSGSGDAGCTSEKAFDGSIATYFDSPHPTGDWVGLDLGVPRRITKIRYCPRRALEGRMPRGRFQGSNTPDFQTEVLDLAVITKEPPTGGVVNEQMIDVPQKFRFVRYIGPPGAHCNIAELEFYADDSPDTAKRP